MSKFLSRGGSQIDDLQRHLSESGSESAPSRVNFQDNAPKRPSRLKNSFRPSSTVSDSTAPLLRTGALDPREPILQRQNSLIEQNASSSGKLGTFEGVFLQVVLSIWGVILYLRLGYILGQVGLIVTLTMFSFGYLITTFTTLSLSAISTNGTVRGGGPYYMISRSLGPEFGGSIGLVVYLGTTLNAVLNSLAAVEGLQDFFSFEKGTLYKLMPEGLLWEFFYGSMILLFSLIICFTGSKIVTRVCLILSALLLLSTLSILCTFLFRSPFEDDARGIVYTSLSWDTLYGNLWPQLSINANGVKETFQSIFGVLFPACIGIMAGASMSGNLEDPSRSIPKGTLAAIFSTFIAYIGLTVLFAATTTRETLKGDLGVMTHIGLLPPLVNIGVLATSFSSSISCFMSASKILQAMSRDNLFPFLRIFGYGSTKGDEPLSALVLTYMLCQIFIMAGEINFVAGFVSMFFVLTFGVTNLACFLLKISSAPNFRPSFRYFKGWTALVGVVICFGAMIYVDPTKALLSTVFACTLFGIVHFTCPPKPWGDVTQSLIYHQVRKYLLRLDSRKDHVKFWRPQILLLVNDPRSSYQLIQFCNALKKGSLYVVGHVLRGDLRAQLGELKRQKNAWLKFVDVSQIKAFIQLTVATDERLGARNILLGSGLGGMTPNILVMGSFNMNYFRRRSITRLDSDSDHSNEAPVICPPSGGSPLSNLLGPLPTDEMKSELPISLTDYVGIIEDALLLGKATAIAFNFSHTPILPCLPKSLQTPLKDGPSYIDLWPIQTTRSDSNTVTNFDSYTMVLQLGCILHMVPQWRSRYTLRVCCFVEHQADVQEERARVSLLLNNLRVPAELHVFWLDGGAVEEYDAILGPSAVASPPQPFAVAGSNADSSEPAQLSTSLRINVPIPEGQGIYMDSSASSEVCDSDHLSDYMTDLDCLSGTQVGSSSPQPLVPSDFNELPASSQHRILNNLMRLQSKNTQLIFSTLPAPELGCSDVASNAHAYLESLESLVLDLPPTFLVHAKSLTVTTSL